MRVTLVLSAILLATAAACTSPPARNDPVTTGMAEMTLVAGQTTQQVVLETFGAPNIVTQQRKGQETWTYERVSFDSSYAKGGMGLLAGGLPGSALVGGAAGASAGKSSSGTRTVTLIVYFDADEIVSDYRVMETHF